MRRLLYSRLFRASYFLAVLAGLIAWQAPARLVDRALAAITDGRIRLLATEGSIWSGSGTLSERDRQVHYPWARMTWAVNANTLLTGTLSLRLAIDDQPDVLLQAGISGFRANLPRLSLPIAPMMRAIPHPLGRLGWSGQADLSGTLRHCSWHGVCDGQLMLVLDRTAVSVLPDPTLGTYNAHLQLAANGSELTIDSTESNRLRAKGSARLGPQHDFHGEISLDGDPVFLDQIASMTADFSRRDAQGVVLRW